MRISVARQAAAVGLCTHAHTRVYHSSVGGSSASGSGSGGGGGGGGSFDKIPRF